MKYKMLRDYDVLKKGQIVFKYTGATYGCCDRNEIAVTAEQDKTPFIGVPAEWIETSGAGIGSSATPFELEQAIIKSAITEAIALQSKPTTPDGETPRTDAASLSRQYIASHSKIGKDDDFVRADFARTLKRELHQLEKELDKANEIADAMTQYAGNDAAMILKVVELEKEKLGLQEACELNNQRVIKLITERDALLAAGNELAKQLDEIPRVDVSSDASFVFKCSSSVWAIWFSQDRRNALTNWQNLTKKPL